MLKCLEGPPSRSLPNVMPAVCMPAGYETTRSELTEIKARAEAVTVLSEKGPEGLVSLLDGLLPVLLRPATTAAPGGQAGAKSPKSVEVEPCLALLGSVERVGKLTGALDSLHLVLTEHPSPAALLAIGEANGLQVRPVTLAAASSKLDFHVCDMKWPSKHWHSHVS